MFFSLKTHSLISTPILISFNNKHFITIILFHHLPLRLNCKLSLLILGCLYLSCPLIYSSTWIVSFSCKIDFNFIILSCRLELLIAIVNCLYCLLLLEGNLTVSSSKHWQSRNTLHLRIVRSILSCLIECALF
jgi:hypothetical protein